MHHRGSTGAGPLQVIIADNQRCDLSYGVIRSDVKSPSRPPPPSRPVQLQLSRQQQQQQHQSFGDNGIVVTCRQVSAAKRPMNGSTNGIAAAGNGAVSTSYRSRLIGCVSGQRSPTSPDELGVGYAVDSCRFSGGGEPATDERRRRLPSDEPELPIQHRRPPISSSTPRINNTSGRLYHSSGDAEDVVVDELPPSVANTSMTVSRRRLSSTSGGPVFPAARDTADDSGFVDERPSSASCRRPPPTPGSKCADENLEPKRGRTRETVSERKKKRVVSDRSPAALWRSISASSLVRSLSRRRSKNNGARQSTGPELVTVGGTDGGNGMISDDCRSKMSSSIDTEDSDADALEADGSRRGRRRACVEVAADAEIESRKLEERRQSDASVSASAAAVDGCAAAAKPFRRRSFFSRSFRRSRSTPAEEFITMATTDAGREQGKAETERLPRKRLLSSGTRNGCSANDVNRNTPLASRASSWASLRRSFTSESLSSVNRARLGSSGCDGNGVVGDAVSLVTVMKLVDFMIGKWISSMTFNADRRELVVVDFRAAYVVDVSALSASSSTGGCRLIRRIVGSKGGTVDRLAEPFGVSSASGWGSDSRLVFTDRADQMVKVYSGRGHYIRSIGQLGLVNVSGVAVSPATGDVFVAGTDSRRVVACRRAAAVVGTKHNRQQQQPGTDVDGPLPVLFQHPYSVAVNSVNDDIIVGDDYAQEVVALKSDGRSVRWRWIPPTAENGENSSPDAPQRPFFPSSICADSFGYVFVADLYNERVYMLDCRADTGPPDDCPCRPLLTRKSGLRGGPLSLAVDETRRWLYVADEERTVRVFGYAGALASAERAARSRLASDGSEGCDYGCDQQQQQQQPVQSRVIQTTAERPFSYCAVDAEEY